MSRPSSKHGIRHDCIMLVATLAVYALSRWTGAAALERLQATEALQAADAGGLKDSRWFCKVSFLCTSAITGGTEASVKDLGESFDEPGQERWYGRGEVFSSVRGE